MAKKGAEPVQQVCAAFLDTMNPSQLMEVHQRSWHPGVRRTTYFIRRVCPFMTKAMIKSAIGTCVKCTTIDPAPVY